MMMYEREEGEENKENEASGKKYEGEFLSPFDITPTVQLRYLMIPSSPAIGFLLATAGICPLFACRGGGHEGLSVPVTVAIGVVSVLASVFMVLVIRYRY